jgi:hypothetical protein
MMTAQDALPMCFYRLFALLGCAFVKEVDTFFHKKKCQPKKSGSPNSTLTN